MPALIPFTPSLNSPPTRPIFARQETTTIAAGGQVAQGCPGQYSGGVLAGSIVGTFFGTLLLIFLWNALTDPRWKGSREVVVERKTVRSRSDRSRRRRSRSGGGTSLSGSSVRRPSRVYSTRD